jgi:hypothetical protein
MGIRLFSKFSSRLLNQVIFLLLLSCRVCMLHRVLFWYFLRLCGGREEVKKRKIKRKGKKRREKKGGKRLVILKGGSG